MEHRLFLLCIGLLFYVEYGKNGSFYATLFHEVGETCLALMSSHETLPVLCSVEWLPDRSLHQNERIYSI